jgi:bifunctional ADP-heptose synthase (sugar kinase/adenylyltransferase)
LDRDGTFTRIPAVLQRVCNTSGAGDTVIAALAVTLAAGADLTSAALIANHAASITCAKVGVATASIGEIISSINRKPLMVDAPVELTFRRPGEIYLAGDGAPTIRQP